MGKGDELFAERWKLNFWWWAHCRVYRSRNTMLYSWSSYKVIKFYKSSYPIKIKRNKKNTETHRREMTCSSFVVWFKIQIPWLQFVFWSRSGTGVPGVIQTMANCQDCLPARLLELDGFSLEAMPEEQEVRDKRKKWEVSPPASLKPLLNISNAPDPIKGAKLSKPQPLLSGMDKQIPAKGSAGVEVLG